jgi:hypothetical protein
LAGSAASKPKSGTSPPTGPSCSRNGRTPCSSGRSGIPFQVCGTFEVRDGQIVLWRDTFDRASGLVNAVIAALLYAFRKVAMTLALKAAARQAS